MPPRRRRSVKLAIGGVASLGAIALAVGLAVPVLPKDSQRVLCGACRGICDVIAPEVECSPMPLRPLDGQATPATSGCPRGYSAQNGGCWFEGKEPPPCPVLTYEKDGRCYTPLMLPGRKTPNAQEP